MLRPSWLVPILLLALTLACSGVSAPTAVPTATPTVLSSMPTATAPLSATPSPTPSPTATMAPTVSEEIALYSAGSRDRPQLYAVDYAGTSHDRERVAHRGSVVSRSGRWLALPSTIDERTLSASAIEVRDTDTDRAFTIDLTADFWLFDMAFDSAETRLALLEMGWPDAGYTPWAYVIVDLADGRTQRFANSADDDLLPGQPLGWTADGEALLVNHFVPYSDAGMIGVYAYSFPPELVSRPVAEVAQRLLLPASDYRAQRLASGGERMLYFARTEGYMPVGYDPSDFLFDSAVNQLWVLDLDRDERGMWIEMTDGSALHHVAAFSPDGARVLFAHGDYVDNEFDTLAFQIHDGDRVTTVGSVPRPSGAWLVDMAWCRPDRALALTRNAAKSMLYLVTLPAGDVVEVAAEEHIELLGCLHSDE